MQFSRYLEKLPPYLFADIDKAKRQAVADGKDVIDLGIGDPDTPTPQFIIDAMCNALKDPSTHKYAMDQGCPELREQIAIWYKKRFNVELSVNEEILALIGSKEGIAHLPFAMNNIGDVNLVPSPCYPPYKNATLLAGAEVYELPLLEENGFMPYLDKIKESVWHKVKILYLNYPNNPTSAVGDWEFFEKCLFYAKKYDFLIAQDMAYSEIAYDGYKPISILEVDKNKEHSIEFHSLSKTYNMTGWRIGWVCGNKDAVKALSKFKSNMDSGIFQAIQLAGIEALKNGDEHIRQIQAMYKRRRDVLVDELSDAGFAVNRPKATFYVWMRVPAGETSISFAKTLLEKASIVATPGVGFGRAGEGYIRFALTVPEDRLKEAVGRLKGVVV